MWPAKKGGYLVKPPQYSNKKPQSGIGCDDWKKNRDERSTAGAALATGLAQM